MNNDKPNFQRNGATPAVGASVSAGNKTEAQDKRAKRKEIAVVWEKQTQQGETYLNIKVTLPDGKEMWMKAFKNKFKKAGEDHKPEYVAFQDRELPNAT